MFLEYPSGADDRILTRWKCYNVQIIPPLTLCALFCLKPDQCSQMSPLQTDGTDSWLNKRTEEVASSPPLPKARIIRKVSLASKWIKSLSSPKILGDQIRCLFQLTAVTHPVLLSVFLSSALCLSHSFLPGRNIRQRQVGRPQCSVCLCLCPGSGVEESLYFAQPKITSNFQTGIPRSLCTIIILIKFLW